MSSHFVGVRCFFSFEFTVFPFSVVELQHAQRERERKNGQRNDGQLRTQKETQL